MHLWDRYGQKSDGNRTEKGPKSPFSYQNDLISTENDPKCEGFMHFLDAADVVRVSKKCVLTLVWWTAECFLGLSTSLRWCRSRGGPRAVDPAYGRGTADDVARKL